MGRKTGLVIRTVFNNQEWKGRCKNPLSDARCFKCTEGGLYINKGNPITEDEQGYCKGEPEDYPLGGDASWCWEQILCRKYIWGNVKGKWRQAFKGMPVYFVYVALDGTLTLWGHSVIDKIDNKPEKYPPIFFRPFEPLPQDKWIEGLNGKEITGESWRQLHFRYLDESYEKYLASLVEGKGKHEYRKGDIHPSEHFQNLSIELRRDIREKIEKIAHTEGREVKDVILEAIAKLIRDRKL